MVEQHDLICGLVINLVGTPRPLPRPRFVHGRAVSIANPKAKAYARALERAAREAVDNVGGADAVRAAFARQGLAVSILAAFQTPKVERWGQPHTIRPDADNLAKQVDRLTVAGALGGDDCRVVDLQVVKVWAARGSISFTIRPVISAAAPVRASLSPAPPEWLKRG